MRIAFVNRSGRSFDPRRYRRFLSRLAVRLDVPAGDLTVLFCGDEEMARLNGAWRGKRRPTDVLSFSGAGGTAEGAVHIGDLAISVDTARRAARAAGWTLSREIETLLTHGVLHLLGFDHETDDGTMMRLQEETLLSIGESTIRGRRRPRPATTTRRRTRRVKAERS